MRRTIAIKGRSSTTVLRAVACGLLLNKQMTVSGSIANRPT